MKTILAALICLAAAAAPGRAAELRILVRDHHGKSVPDAVVVAIPSDPKVSQRAKVPADSIDQVDKQFVPYVKPVFVGSQVRFPNSDKIRHQVYSFSPAKKFELPLYAGTDAPPVVFDKPGVVVLGCNIHDWMVGYIYVSESPFFAKTEAAGTAMIGDLPPGEYTVRVWHPGIEHADEIATRQITLNADAPASVEWSLALKPQYRIPRAGAASPGYP
jgi:plastocyanin